jgi:hypothetical protein
MRTTAGTSSASFNVPTSPSSFSTLGPAFISRNWHWKSGNDGFPRLSAFSRYRLKMTFSRLVKIKECAIFNVQPLHPLRGTTAAEHRRPARAVGASAMPDLRRRRGHVPAIVARKRACYVERRLGVGLLCPERGRCGLEQPTFGGFRIGHEVTMAALAFLPSRPAPSAVPQTVWSFTGRRRVARVQPQC